MALSVVVFVLVKDVARIGKGRDPAPVNQPCVPTHVIDMQVGAHHVVDRFAVELLAQDDVSAPHQILVALVEFDLETCAAACVDGGPL